jgi:hypothetical protein
MPYTNVDIFREKGAKSFSKKSKRNYSGLFLLLFNSKLSHFDKNLNLNLNLIHKWFLPTWRKPIRF